jgi:glucose/arabinose dehydrogenase
MTLIGLTAWLIAAATTIAAESGESSRPPASHWIWAAEDRSSGQRAVLRTQINIPPAVRSARLRCAAEYCQVTITLGGERAFVVEDYGPWIDVDVTQRLRSGRHEVVLDATSSEGPAAVAFELAWTTADGTSSVVRSGTEWEARLSSAATERGDVWNAAVSFGPVADELWGLGGLPAATTPFDDYEQWRKALDGAAATDPNTFFAPDGFKVELLRAATADEGSWVAVTCDPQGRIIIAREDRGLLRLRLSADRRSVEQIETVNDTLEECRGLLFAYDALYVNANNSKGLYRLRDNDGDDAFDEVWLLREFPGGPGHGRNQLALGPDGMVYSIHGDAVDLPAENYTDRTSPFREARRGERSKEGHLLRTDRDGSRWELVAAGLRNPFGVAFHPQHGEAFTYDADAEFDMGSAWYRPTRLLHLVSGGDFGWRGVTGGWPPYYPDHSDNALPVIDIGHGSPTAVRFGERSAFPPRYRRALFILDWTRDRRAPGAARRQLCGDCRDFPAWPAVERHRARYRSRRRALPGDRRPQDAIGAVSRALRRTAECRSVTIAAANSSRAVLGETSGAAPPVGSLAWRA